MTKLTAICPRKSLVPFLSAISVLALSLTLTGPVRGTPVNDQHWSLLAGRLFPTFIAFETGERGNVSKSSDFVNLLKARRSRLDSCQHVAACVLNASLWSDADIEAVAANADRKLSAKLAKAPTMDIDIKAQVARELHGLNDIIKVYGLGAVPLNPQIDGPIDAPGSAQFNVTVADAVLLGEAGDDDLVAALDPSVAMALALLDVNNRDDAVAFEPLDATYNSAATLRAHSVDWKRYPYTAIIVPGKGPDDLTTPLSARGKLRVRLAAGRFADGIAPFIIVTGGSVHPKGTKFAEAIEMRKALIERYGIPADCIVVEPYARYTITNLRNSTRRLMAMDAPLDRDALIITDVDQSRSIESPDFRARNQDRLGYQPGTIGSRLSPYELTFKPSSASQRLNPADPLDP